MFVMYYAYSTGVPSYPAVYHVVVIHGSNEGNRSCGQPYSSVAETDTNAGGS